MTQILLHLLLRLTLGGGFFVLLLLGVRVITKNIFPARWRRLAAAISLFFFFAPFSVPLPQPSPAEFTPVQHTHAIANAVPRRPNPMPYTLTDGETSQVIPLIVWICGAAVFTMYHAVGWARFSQAVKAAALPADGNTERLYQALAQEMRVQRPPRLIRCAGVGAPMVAGIFQPLLLLPRECGTPEQLALILRHELTHYKSGDLPLKLAALLAASLHWFNPLAHVPGYLLEADCELACDERLVLSMDPAQRKQYGAAILEYISLAQTPLSAPFSRKRLLKGRLETILHAKALSRFARMVCAGVTGALLIAGVITVSLMAHALEPASKSVLPTQPVRQTAPNEWSALSLTSAHSSEGNPPIAEEASGTKDMGTFPLSPPIPGAPIQDGFMSYYAHNGTDYAAPEGTPVLAAADGTVVQVKYSADGYGNYIILDHGDGAQTLYAHCTDLLVRMGQSVGRGQAIATAGTTGNTAYSQCHFELRQSGIPVDPIPAMEERHDFVSASGDSQRELVQTLINSVSVANGHVQFTIPPEAPPQGEYWVIHIAGRSPEGHPLHWLEAESDGKLWVSGKTYSFPLDPAAFLGQGKIDPEAAKALCEITVGLVGANASSAETYTAYPVADWVKLQKQTTPAIPEYVPVIVLSPPMDNEILGVNGYLGHIGLDYSGPAGKHVLAAADGIVTGVAEDGNGNQTIFINHGNGFETLYDLCSGALVKEGDSVKQGQALAVINRSGSQPPHLHFEVHLNGQPVDPSPYLPGR